jgi:polyisoprenoid-binding protein YceI
MTFERWSFYLATSESKTSAVERRNQVHGIDKCQCLVLGNMFSVNVNRSRRVNERSRLSTLIRYVLASTACLMAFLASSRPSYAQVPTYEFTSVESGIKFGVESSVSIQGVFEKWNASIKFSSRDIRSAVLDIEIEAGSVNTGSHMKDNKLKGKDFFNVKESPLITFKSTKIVQTGPNTFDIEGNFTIRGVTKTEKLTLTSDSKGTPTGSLDGTMAFDRKDYGMTSGIPFIKVANRVEVNVRLKWRRVSGPPPVFQQ